MHRNTDILETISTDILLYQQLRETMVTEMEQIIDDRFDDVKKTAHLRRQLEQTIFRLNAEISWWLRSQSSVDTRDGGHSDEVSSLLKQLRAQMEETLSFASVTGERLHAEKRKTAEELKKLKTKTYAISSYVRHEGR